MTALGLGWLLRRLGAWQGVLALTYHRIGTPDATPFDHDVWSATAENFEAQLTLLQKHSDVIHPRDLASVQRRRAGRFSLVTFDDGYRDNYERAFPILKRKGLPATFFISTGFIDRPRAAWWDDVAWMVKRSAFATLDLRPWIAEPLAVSGGEPRDSSVGEVEPRRSLDRADVIRRILKVYKGLPEEQTPKFLEAVATATGSGRCPAAAARDNWMTWPMLREMHAAGMAIGGHTVDHPILSRCTPERQRQEIFGCGERLKHELGIPMLWFAYPRGKRDSFTQETRQCLKEASVQWAFSYYGGFQRFGSWDASDLRRTGIELQLGRCQFQTLMALPQVFA
jgi:peptidoglycan/xylan/chitin deacetylase (PgdA/CDA1 family)